MIAYEPRTRTSMLPITGLEAEYRETLNADEEFLMERLADFDNEYPAYLARMTKRLGSVEKVTRDDILELPALDKDFLSIEIMRLQVEDRKDKSELKAAPLLLEGACPGCGKPANFKVNLATLDQIPLPEGATGPNPTFRFTLPWTGMEVEWRYPTVKEELQEKMAPKKNSLRADSRRIVSVDGNTQYRLADMRRWPTEDQRALREDFFDKECGYDPRVRIKHDCGRTYVIDLLEDTGFLFRGIPPRLRG